MSIPERRAWAQLGMTVAVYVVYLGLVIAAAGGGPIADADYIAPMIGTVIGGIVGAIVLEIILGIGVGVVAGMRSGRREKPEREVRDERDRQIDRFGEAVGRAFLVIGGLAVIALAMLEAAPFWIANVMYLAFVVSALTDAAARIASYRRGAPAW